MSTLTEKIERDYPAARMQAATELPSYIDDRQAITRRDMRTIDTVCILTFAFLGVLFSWFILSLEIGPVRIMIFWAFMMAYIIMIDKFFKLLRRTYIVALPTHDYIENGEERKHEVAVHGQTLPA